MARVEDGVDFPVVGVDELDPVEPGAERFARARERIGIAIESDEAGRAVFEDRAGVAAEADGAVDEEAAALGSELGEHL
jgi:hypothetical protein